ncbi:hypothetical protein BGX27_004352, partial [Mortierella sp. AM989]
FKKMTKFHQALACIVVLLSIVNTTYASFAFCVINRDMPRDRIAGFWLWNDRGDNAGGGVRFPKGRGYASVSNNRWTVELFGTDSPSLQSIRISNNKYKYSSFVPFHYTPPNIRIEHGALIVDYESEGVYHFCVNT